MMTTKTQALSLADLDPFPDQNPNVMSDADLATLAAAMGRHGALQPILVAPIEGGRYLVVDGVHRSKAATLAGRETLDAVVLPAGLPKETLRLLRIGMNKLRGDLNLARVAEELSDLRTLGVPVEDLLLTGYREEDIDALIRASSAPDDGEELLGQGIGDVDEKPTEPKVFVLELVFENAKEMARAKRALKRAAGDKSAPLARGLLNMIDGGA